MRDLVKLSLSLQWIGQPGAERLRTDEDPGLRQRVLDLVDNVGWLEDVRFDLTPTDAEGHDVGAAATTWPTISWDVTVEMGGDIVHRARLIAHQDAEGDVIGSGRYVHIGTRPYDEAKGYALKVRGERVLAPGALIRVRARDVLSGVESNEVAYKVS